MTTVRAGEDVDLYCGAMLMAMYYVQARNGQHYHPRRRRGGRGRGRGHPLNDPRNIRRISNKVRR